MLSPQLLRISCGFWRLVRPKRCLFPGLTRTGPLEPTTLYAACLSARAAAGLAKEVTPHTRGLLATHLLEKGIYIIQGLARRATPLVATKRISRTPSPLDPFAPCDQVQDRRGAQYARQASTPIMTV